MDHQGDSNSSSGGKRRVEEDTSTSRGDGGGGRGGPRGGRGGGASARGGRASALGFSSCLAYGSILKQQSNNSSQVQAPVVPSAAFLAAMASFVPSPVTTASSAPAPEATTFSQATGISSHSFAQIGDVNVGRAYHQEASLKVKTFQTRKRIFNFSQLLNPRELKEENEIKGAKESKEVFDLCSSFHDGTAKGRDHPTGDALRKANKMHKCTVFIKSNLNKTQGEPAFLDFGHRYKFKYNYDSQNPGIQFSLDLDDIKKALPTVIYRGHLQRMYDSDKNAHIFRKAQAGQLDMNEASIRSIFDNLGVTQVPKHIIDRLIINTKALEESYQNLDIYVVKVSYNARFGPLGSGDLARELRAIEGQFPALIIWTAQSSRLAFTARGAPTTMWEKLMNANINGVFQHYSEQMAPVVTGQPGKDKDYITYVNNFDTMTLLPAPHLVLLNIEQPSDSLDISVASIEKKFCFSCLEEVFHIMSLGVTREQQYAHRVTNALFGTGKLHRGTIMKASPNVVEILFTMTVTDGQDVRPISPGTGLKIRQVVTPSLESMEVDTSGDKGMDTEDTLDSLLTDFNMIEESKPTESVWEGQVLDGAGEKELRIALNLKSSGESERFVCGSTMSFELLFQDNNTSALRQLSAIRYMSVPKKLFSRERNLQNAILATGETVEPSRPLYSRCQDPERRAVAIEYLTLLDLNQDQENTAYTVITNTNPVTMMQGPPGTGKTTTNVAIVTVCALLSFTCLVCAPANGATRALLSNAYSQREKVLREAFKNHRVADSFELIYFPSWATIANELITPRTGEDEPKAMLWYHINEYMTRLSQEKIQHDDKNPEGRLDEIKTAQKWLTKFEKIQKGRVLGTEEQKEYLRVSQLAVGYVFQDYKARGTPMLVFSTCNASARLLQKNFSLQPSVVLIDELAHGSEADAWIPLQFNPLRVVLVGDKKQLEPTALGFLRSEAHEQYSLSMYSRLDLIYPKTTLRINYRFGPRLAIFPSMMSYPFLGCGPNTLKPNRHAEAIEHFMATSDMGKELKRLRVPAAEHVRNIPELNTKASTRLCFDIADGFSSTIKRTHSQMNYAHINFVVTLLYALFDHQKKHTNGSIHRIIPADVTIISPYKRQKNMILEQLKMRGLAANVITADELEKLQAGTIEVMQGFENDIVILDLVIANEWNPASLGFVSKWLRMNVGLTRAKACLWIVCNWSRMWLQLDYMMKINRIGYQNWASLLIDLQEMGDVVTIRKGGDSYMRDWFPSSLPANPQEMISRDWTLHQRRMTEEESEFKHGSMLKIVALDNKAQRSRLRPIPAREHLDKFSDNLHANRQKWLSNHRAEQARVSNRSRDHSALVAQAQSIVDSKIEAERLQTERAEELEVQEKAAAAGKTASTNTETAKAVPVSNRFQPLVTDTDGNAEEMEDDVEESATGNGDVEVISGTDVPIPAPLVKDAQMKLWVEMSKDKDWDAMVDEEETMKIDLPSGPETTEEGEIVEEDQMAN